MSSKNRSLVILLVLFFVLVSISSPLFLNSRAIEIANTGSIYAESPRIQEPAQSMDHLAVQGSLESSTKRLVLDLPQPTEQWKTHLQLSWGGEPVDQQISLSIAPRNLATEQGFAATQSRPARLLAPKEEFFHRDLSQTRFSSVFDSYLILGYYGNPNSNRMGKLGEHSIPRLAEILQETAQLYDVHNGEKGVKRAFHLIFATVWPDANVGRLPERQIMEYINFANQHDMMVILDHQIGRFGVEESFREMLPYLTRGNVHLAIDPEWRTLQPGREIGWVYAEEINRIQEMMQNYMLEQGIFERRMLMVHQFHPRMIQNRDQVRSDFPLVDLLLNADGFGHPALKLSTWRLIAEADNFPFKGFKLFYPKPWKTTGIDVPLMTPEQVMGIVPRPVYINYQ